MEYQDTDSSGLRHRTSLANESQDQQSPATSSSTAWQQELFQARQALADRVKKQYEEDGSESVPHPGQSSGYSDRRGSSDSEEESEDVRQFLTGSWRGQAREAEETTEEVEVLKEDAADAERGDQSGSQSAHANERPAPPAPAQDAEPDEKMCRICFEGEDPDLGRLFSPCLCRGTSRFVHVACLDRWRAASVGATSFYKCDQCKYEYKLRRTKIAGLAQNKAALLVMTLFSFTLIIYLAGFLATFILDAVEARSARLTGHVFEDLFVNDYVIMGESIHEAVAAFNTLTDATRAPALTWESPAEDDSNTAYRFFKRLTSSHLAVPVHKSEPTFLRRTIQHFVKGFSLVGLSSFFSSFVASTLLGPFGFRNPLFRMVRPARRNGDNRVNGSQLLIIAFILLGTWKAVTGVYRTVKKLSRYALKSVEGLVMDV